MPDPELHEIQARLSTPAEALPGGVPRRRFLQGALAAGAGTVLLPSWADHLAAAATPIGARDGVLVVLQLGGGNDGLSLVPPLSSHPDHGRYRDARGNLAVSGALPLAANLGLHPKLPRLKARWDAGNVAVVRGVGQTTADLSHFTSTETWMAGSHSSSRTTGWLGRWVDGVPEAAAGLRAVSVGSEIPLHLTGVRAAASSVIAGASPFGSIRSQPYMTPVYDAIEAMGEGTTGRGRLSDLVADTGAASIGLATELAPVLGTPLPPGQLVRNMALAAQLVNADLGIRVLTLTHRDYDLHSGLAYTYGRLMDELDLALETFFTTLAARFQDRTSLMTFSEFGRRVSANDSSGTGHGTSAAQLVIGAGVKGGMYGAQPRLNDVDSRGNLKVEVDLRSYYASIVDGWLAGGSGAVLGGAYEDLKLFRNPPGGPVTPPPPPPPSPTGPWKPFVDAETLVRQQYLDFLGRPADAPGVSYWVGKLNGGSTISWVINAFLSSREFGVAVAPAARLALACFGDPPAYDDLMTWAGRVRRGDPIAAIAGDVATRPAFATRYGSLGDRAFVDRAHRDATGSAPAASWLDDRAAELAARTATRADVMAVLASLPATAAHLRVQVEVTMTYAGLLRRSPEPSGYAFWVDRGNQGTSIQRLVAMFFAVDEYTRRFA